VKYFTDYSDRIILTT